MNQGVIEIINGVGFPITMCLMLFWFNREMVNQQRDILDNFKQVIFQNTENTRRNNELITQLIIKLDEDNK